MRSKLDQFEADPDSSSKPEKGSNMAKIAAIMALSAQGLLGCEGSRPSPEYPNSGTFSASYEKTNGEKATVSMDPEQRKEAGNISDDEKEALQHLDINKDCTVLKIEKSPGGQPVNDKVTLDCKVFGQVDALKECSEPVWKITGSYPDKKLGVSGCNSGWVTTIHTKYATISKKE